MVCTCVVLCWVNENGNKRIFLQFIFPLLSLLSSNISDNINMLIVLIVCRVISLTSHVMPVCSSSCVYFSYFCRYVGLLSSTFALLFIFMWYVRTRVKNKMRKNDNKSPPSLIAALCSAVLFLSFLSFHPLHSALISLTLVTDCPHSFISFVFLVWCYMRVWRKKKMVCLHGIYYFFPPTPAPSLLYYGNDWNMQIL